jgi:hypothetical protein
MNLTKARALAGSRFSLSIATGGEIADAIDTLQGRGTEDDAGAIETLNAELRRDRKSA